MPLDEWFVEQDEQEALYDLLYDELLTVYQLGETDGLIKLAKLRQGISVDWAQVNEAAALWAERYTFDLVKELTQTTREQLQTALGAFFRERGMTRGGLERLILQGPDGIPDLVSKGGRIISAADRAEMIAVTEVTRAYSAGTVEAVGSTGLARLRPTVQPPLHVRCRCDISPSVRDDNTLSWTFQTKNDDRVCAICAPYHAVDVGAG